MMIFIKNNKKKKKHKSYYNKYTRVLPLLIYNKGNI